MESQIWVVGTLLSSIILIVFNHRKTEVSPFPRFVAG